MTWSMPTGRRRGFVPQALTISSCVAAVLLVCGSPAGAATTASGRVDIHQYLGVWTYDEPQPTTGENIAVVVLAADNHFKVPQIGTVRFSADPTRGPNAVVAVTDQGCTWHFAATAASLELTSSTQHCFNTVIDSGYTMRKWSVIVHGQQERESIVASSQLSYGTFPFRLADGRRTKVVARNVRGDAARFIGDWTYGPATSSANIVTLARGQQVSRQPIAQWPVYATDGGRKPARPGNAQVRFTEAGDRSAVAVTPDGCRWHFQLFGNTAELDHRQTCRLADSGVETMNFWSAAADGSHEDSVMSGTVRDDSGTMTAFELGIGSLERNPR